MDIRERWFRTLSIVAILSLLYLIIMAVVAPVWTPRIIGWLQGRMGNAGAAMAAMILFIIPPILFVVGAFTMLESHRSAARRGDDETRCRRCRHILRGLTEPRCPECGERI